MLLHVRRLFCLLFKADIARVFDFVAWPFLLEILKRVGFLISWLNWMSTILSIVSMRILMNRLPGEKICHTRSLH
jgi:hypothetical protein